MSRPLRPSVRRTRTPRVVAALAALGVAAVTVGTTPTAAADPASHLRVSAPPSAVEPVVVLAQRVERQVVLTPRRDARTRVSPKGTDLWQVSALGSFDLPDAARRAYERAASSYGSCGISWTVLAGVGRVESDHGRYAGAVLGSDGVARPAIIGLPLNGVGPVAAIRDSDGGRLDGDRRWDRAVGPMQFIPGTWAWVGRDGDGDGVSNPHDIDDAAMAAASYLCRLGSLTSDEGVAKAVYRYNQSDYYVALVMAFAEGYRTGSFSIPSPPPPPGAGNGLGPDRSGKNGKPGKKSGKDGKGDKGSKGSKGSKGGKGGSATPTPTPTPSPTPDPTPEPTPEPTPTDVARTGDFHGCDGGWCLDSLRLDVGPGGHLDAQAAADLDGDGSRETNREELTGLEGRRLTVVVREGTAPAVVMEIAGHRYRDADGNLL